ncbi:hypothetical protein KSP40_PGU006322 [Platanthera guangdongensis]|uniref:Uncharacterized protein n=1 Tax=Platanthera guangdongensis TaxID=2320717 RepID=A0ABR2N585_9ASPA
MESIRSKFLPCSLDLSDLLGVPSSGRTPKLVFRRDCSSSSATVLTPTGNLELPHLTGEGWRRLFGLIFGEVSISYNRSNHTSYMFNLSWRSIYASPKINRSIFASPQDNRIAYESSILPKPIYAIYTSSYGNAEIDGVFNPLRQQVETAHTRSLTASNHGVTQDSSAAQIGAKVVSLTTKTKTRWPQAETTPPLAELSHKRSCHGSQSRLAKRPITQGETTPPLAELSHKRSCHGSQSRLAKRPITQAIAVKLGAQSLGHQSSTWGSNLKPIDILHTLKPPSHIYDNLICVKKFPIPTESLPNLNSYPTLGACHGDCLQPIRRIHQWLYRGSLKEDPHMGWPTPGVMEEEVDGVGPTHACMVTRTRSSSRKFPGGLASRPLSTLDAISRRASRGLTSRPWSTLDAISERASRALSALDATQCVYLDYSENGGIECDE